MNAAASQHPEVSDDEVERIREKLTGSGDATPGGFDDDERRIAAKLLGQGDAKRLERAKAEGKAFKYRPPVNTAEYFRVPSTETRPWDSWSIEVRQNGRLIYSWHHLDDAECGWYVAELTRRGIEPKRFITEAEVQAAKRQAEYEQRDKRQEHPVSRFDMIQSIGRLPAAGG